MTDKMNLSRRQFIGITGGIIGASALAAAIPLGAAPTQNKPKINFNYLTINQSKKRSQSWRLLSIKKSQNFQQKRL